MEETDVFAQEAADVAVQAVKEGVARVKLSWDEVYNTAKADIAASRALVDDMQKLGHIKEPPEGMLENALEQAITEVSAKKCE
jgi:malate dehydrogenase (oxaloacetate-decarboxylating)